MAFLSGIVTSKEAILNFADQVPTTDFLTTAISTFVSAEMSSNAIDLAYQSYQWAHEVKCFYKRLDQDLQQLMDDADEYQKFLELEPCLIAIDLQSAHLEEKSDLKFNDSLVLPSDIKALFFTHLTVEQIARFAQVSKCCHLATKTDSIWEHKLGKLFGGIKCLPKEQCGFNMEQQFKIIYKRTWWLLKKYKLSYKNNYELILKFYNCSASQSLRYFEKQGDYYIHCASRIRSLVGENYCGTLESIDPHSKQGRIIAGIKQLKSDCQELSAPDPFKFYLEQAKKALEIQSRLKDFPERVKKFKELADGNAITGMFITATINKRVWEYSSKLYLCTETLCGKMNEKLNQSIGFTAPSHSTRLFNQMLKLSPMPDAYRYSPTYLYQSLYPTMSDTHQ